MRVKTSTYIEIKVIVSSKLTSLNLIVLITALNVDLISIYIVDTSWCVIFSVINVLFSPNHGNYSSTLFQTYLIIKLM